MIGIVGGVGPYAGLDLAKNVFDNTLAATDQEHLSVCMLSLSSTILDRTEYLTGKVKMNPGKAIANVILQIEKLGATVAGIPCNTAHAPEIFNVTKQVLTDNNASINLLNMVDETIKAIIANHPNAKKIGVLSTTGTFQFGIYSRPLQNSGLEPIVPDIERQERIIHPAIYDKIYGIKAKSNPVTDRAKEDLLDSILFLKQNGAELVIKGCTEIALAIPEKTVYDVPMIDPSIVLARSLINQIDPKKLKPAQ